MDRTSRWLLKNKIIKSVKNLLEPKQKSNTKSCDYKLHCPHKENVEVCKHLHIHVPEQTQIWRSIKSKDTARNVKVI